MRGSVWTGALIATATVAQGQSTTPRAVREKADYSRQYFREFGQCMVRQSRRLAREFLLSQSGNYAVDDRYLRLANARCLSMNEIYIRGFRNPHGLRLSPSAMRYLIAETLVESELGSFNPSVISLAAPLSHPVLDPAQFSEIKYPQYDRKLLKAARDRAIAENALSLYGECVVRAEPFNAQRLLKSRINSDAERQILSAIVPTLTRCVDKGQKLTTDPLVLRGTIAVNYYRLAHAPRVASAGVTK